MNNISKKSIPTTSSPATLPKLNTSPAPSMLMTPSKHLEQMLEIGHPKSPTISPNQSNQNISKLYRAKSTNGFPSSSISERHCSSEDIIMGGAPNQHGNAPKVENVSKSQASNNTRMHHRQTSFKEEMFLSSNNQTPRTFNNFSRITIPKSVLLTDQGKNKSPLPNITSAKDDSGRLVLDGCISLQPEVKNVAIESQQIPETGSSISSSCMSNREVQLEQKVVESIPPTETAQPSKKSLLKGFFGTSRSSNNAKKANISITIPLRNASSTNMLVSPSSKSASMKSAQHNIDNSNASNTNSETTSPPDTVEEQIPKRRMSISSGFSTVAPRLSLKDSANKEQDDDKKRRASITRSLMSPKVGPVGVLFLNLYSPKKKWNCNHY